MRLRALSAVIMALAAAAAEPARAADLSGFLGGFETSCSGSDAFVRYMFSLGEKYTITGDRRRKVAVPAEFKRSIGKETVSDKGRYVAVSIPLKGTYRGLPVSRLYFELAHETHHYVAAAVFDAPLEEVKKALGRSLAQARKTLARMKPDYGTGVDILREGRGAKFVCMIE